MNDPEAADPGAASGPGGRVAWRTPRGFSVMRLLAHLLLRAGGWTVQGHVPDVPKSVAILGQHTSNWDAVWSVVLKYVMEDRPVGWVMKDNAFRFPFRSLLLWLGCIPVSRSAPEGFVGQVSRKFMDGRFAVLCITPEGSRSKVVRWKTGFYRIAMECDVPIILGFIDYKRHVMGAGPSIWPTGDYDADMREISAFYRDITPRHPELASEVR